LVVSALERRPAVERKRNLVVGISFFGISFAVVGAVWIATLLIGGPTTVAAKPARPTKATTRAASSATTAEPNSSPTLSAPQPPPTAPPAVDTSTPDADLLDRLVIAAEIDVGGYARDSFGYPQAGTDSRGCNTRARVLIRDSTVPAQVDYPGCEVLAGRWVDAYTGEAHEAPGEVSVDHLVALKEAWRSGAASWDGARRAAFGNDLETGALVLVAGSGNSSKGDKDPASWAPADPARAKVFARNWLTSKVRWGLTADPAEVAAIRHFLGAPAGPSGPSGLLTPQAPAAAVTTRRPTTTRAPTTSPTTGGGRYYANCTEAKADGHANIRRGDPGYRQELDRNNDGVACEA
jgi:hypothetical protein